MMDYTKCWLEYPLIRSMAGRTLTLRNLVEGPVGASAGKELALGLSGLYGMEHRDGLFAARYRDIKAVKAVTIEGWNNYALKVLMKNGTIRLCSSYDAKDLVPLNKLALSLSEFLRAYP